MKTISEKTISEKTISERTLLFIVRRLARRGCCECGIDWFGCPVIAKVKSGDYAKEKDCVKYILSYHKRLARKEVKP